MLVETADLAGVAISPDGTLVAVREERASVERNAYDSVWLVQRLDKPSVARRVADGGSPLRATGVSVAEKVIWSPDSQWIYFRALQDGEIQVWRAAADGGRSEQVTHDAANVETFALSADGRFLTYRTGPSRSEIDDAEKAEYDSGIRIDGSIYAAEGLFRSVVIDGVLRSERTGPFDASRPWRGTLLSDRPKRYRSVDLQSHSVAPAAQPAIERLEEAAGPNTGGVAARATLTLGEERRTALLSGPPDGRELVVSGLPGRSTPLHCKPCDGLKIEGIAWRNPSEIVFTATDGRRGFSQNLYRWRVGSATVDRLTKSEGLLASDRSGMGSTCAVSARYAACVTASAATPPRLERINLDTGQRELLYNPNEWLAELSEEVSVEFLSWKDAAGRSFTGHLFTSPSTTMAGPVPLFVTYYICPGYLRGGMGDEWPLMTMAANGIAALCINFQRPPRANRDAAADYETGLAAVAAAVEILSKRGTIDRSRVGMGGLSFGTEITTWVAAHSDLLAAASVSSTNVLPTWYWLHSVQAGWDDVAMRQWRLGSPDETPERWRQLSPAYFADRIKAPLLFQMSEGEFRPSVEFFRRLTKANTPAEMWVFPNEPHQKFQPRHKLAVYERNLDWFRFWLQDYVDPDPRKADQFARWSTLRNAMPRRASGQEPAGRARAQPLLPSK